MPGIDVLHQITLLPACCLDKSVCLSLEHFSVCATRSSALGPGTQVHSKHGSLCLSKPASCFDAIIIIFSCLKKICVNITALVSTQLYCGAPFVLCLTNICARISTSICNNVTTGNVRIKSTQATYCRLPKYLFYKIPFSFPQKKIFHLGVQRKVRSGKDWAELIKNSTVTLHNTCIKI